MLDLEAVSENLTMDEYAVINGIHLTMNEGAVWQVSGESRIVSLHLAEGASIQAAEGCGIEIYVNCEGLEAAAGEKVEELTAGDYENVVIVCRDGAAALEVVEIEGEDYISLEGLKNYLASLFGLETEAAGGPSTVITGARLLDASYNGEVLDVLVQDGKIVAVGEDLEGDEVIDLTGYTLLPGLIDAHVHVASSDYNIGLLATWCSQGITSVRELGMLSTLNEEDFLPLVEAAGEDPANACLVSTGKYLDVAGGYGMGPTGNMGITVTTPEEAAAEIEHKAELGYPQVKVGINSDEYRMTAEQFSAIIETAHANGMEVSAHVNYADHLAELVGLGIDEAAHTPSDEMPEELVTEMVEKGVSMNSSGAESSEEIKIGNLAEFYKAGGIITVGTDKMRDYDSSMASLLAEMRVLRAAGLTVQQVIACATHNNAAALEIEAGDIAPGLEADLIAVKGEVDEELQALESVDFVMNNGVVVVG